MALRPGSADGALALPSDPSAPSPLPAAWCRVCAALQPLGDATAKFLDDLRRVVEANQVGR